MNVKIHFFYIYDHDDYDELNDEILVLIDQQLIDEVNDEIELLIDNDDEAHDEVDEKEILHELLDGQIDNDINDDDDDHIIDDEVVVEVLDEIDNEHHVDQVIDNHFEVIDEYDANFLYHDNLKCMHDDEHDIEINDIELLVDEQQNDVIDDDEIQILIVIDTNE